MKALLPLCLLAAPAVAQTLELPAECVPFATVQQADCSVTTFMRCDGDPDGSVRAVASHAEGVSMINLFSRQWEWLDSDFLDYREQLAETVDPIDIHALAQGQDSWDFTTDSALYGVARYEGEESLTGQSRMLDGFEMLETRYRITGTDADGVGFFRASGTEWLVPELGILLGGESLVGMDGEKPEPRDFTPVAIATPGAAGFLSTVPTDGCTD